MGAYLAKPVTTKQSFDDAKGKLSCGGSEMQGWRVSMEVSPLFSINGVMAKFHNFLV
jgi:uncharacterized Zn-binding protein involved in type VI secretion